MTPVIMPQIGQDVETGLITAWYKQVGEKVQSGEVIATVEGDKAAFDIEAEASGLLLEIVVAQGQEGRVLEPIAYIGQADEMPGRDRAAGAQPASITPGGSGRPGRLGGEGASSAPGESGRRLFVSPSARRTAQELGVELSGLKGSGPGGRIVKHDVLAAAGKAGLERSTTGAAPPAAPADRAPAAAEDTVIPFSRTRRIIAERLSLSKATIPHFYLIQDIDMEKALSWREQYNRLHGSRLTVTALVVRAAALTLRDFPRLNAHVEKDRLVVRARINIGVATSTEEGLLVPVIADADGKDERALALEIEARSTEARQGRLDPNLGSSFTVTSLGMFGTQCFLPIINPPEAAILAVGAAEPRPVAIDGLLGVHRLMTVVLACDHRAIDGAEAARFLRSLQATFSSRYQPAG